MPKDDVRYEIKMVAQAPAYDQLRMFLRLHSAGFRVLYPPRTVQSIYFDTCRGRALEENLSGQSLREKIRFRWYGEMSTDVRGTLERKVRQNMLGWKDLLRFKEEVAIEGETRPDFARVMRAALTEEWSDVRASALEPVQWIRYEREYYCARNVRVTIDRALRSADQRYRFRLSSRFAAPMPNVMIVEAKCGAEHYEELRALLNRSPLPIDKCSKFVYASTPGALTPSIMAL